MDSTPRQIELRGDDTVDPGSDPRVDRPTPGDSNLPDEFGGTKSRNRLAFFVVCGECIAKGSSMKRFALSNDVSEASEWFLEPDNEDTLSSSD